ncbi:MAG: hypothetical protein JSU70_13555 [Phycisphaerales bacterium]|nr:MAG: hypothetical protein JSU70_13555 [Phycisphaerales bacterium]
MKKRTSIVLVLALGLASVSLAAEDTWTAKAPMPTARYVLSSGVIDGKIYAIGGSSGPCLRTVESYDPVTDTWTRKANMSMAIGAAASSVVNGRIYVIGGKPSLHGAPYSSVREYDATTDTWRARANMPTARSWFSSSVVDGKIYAIGGTRSYEGTRLSRVEEYDPATDTWTRKADMPTARACLSTSAVNGKIYAIGGTRSNPWYQGLYTVEEYDPATDTWTTKADMSTGRTYVATCAVNGKIYAVGGVDSSGQHVSSVEEYDPATDTWTRRADMSTARSGLTTSVVNSKIYAIGGWTGYSTNLSTVEEYDPDPFVVDFNGDETVNFKDFCMLAQYWHQDQSPFVYHRLDYQDLAVLSEYWLKETLPVTLIAYWKLDEIEGLIAHDSVGVNDGTLNGEPLWQPTGGVVNGALELDGINDYVSTPFVLNPAEGPFSATAWIKGSKPGGAIISQTDRGGLGGTWLGTEPSDGTLMTNLMWFELKSESVVTDEQWHHVGLVWDGARRYLYVDGAEVAKDAADIFAVHSTGDLHLGADKGLTGGSFWLGLIDDVRIYDRAIKP